MKYFFLFLLISSVALGGPYGSSSGPGVAPSGAGGLATLNSQTETSQTFASGTAGTDFAISSSGGVHTFNIPSASATARGLVSTSAQTIAGAKTFSTPPILSSLTASRALYVDGTNNITASSVTATELGYLSGVSSALQTQLSAKAPLASPSFTGQVIVGETSSGGPFLIKSLTGNSNGLKMWTDSVSDAAYIYNHYAASTFLGSNNASILELTTGGGTKLLNLTATTVPYLDASKVLTSSAVTPTELGYVSGVTSAIQTQMDALKVGSHRGHIETPTAKTYYLDQYAEFAYTINRITIDMSAGTATAKLTIDGVDVTSCTSISASTTEATTTCTGANSVAVGNTVALVITSPSSAADFAFTVKYTR